MKKVPLAFQNAVRNIYFDILRKFIEEEGLTLNLENYGEDVILSEGFLRSPAIVAIIDSHSSWGEPNDFTNESTPRGLNGRKYDGLKIIIKDNRYRQRIDKIADNLKRHLAEDVIMSDDEKFKIVYG